MAFTSETFYAKNATVGGFFLQEEHLKELGKEETITLSEQEKDDLLMATKQSLEAYQLAHWERRADYLIAKSTFTFGSKQSDSSDERVGDIRIRYVKVPCSQVYMLGQ